MSLSTLATGLSVTGEPDLLAEDAGLATAINSSRPPIVLSAHARDRLDLLNRILANCVPQSLAARDEMPAETQWE